LDVNQLVLWALLNLVKARKDRGNRQALRQTAFEFAYLAHSVDPFNASALNLLANHRFHVWLPYSIPEGCAWIREDALLVSADAATFGLRQGNQVRFANLPRSFTIQNVTGSASCGDWEVQLSPLASGLKTYPAPVSEFEVKPLHEVIDFAQRALALSALAMIRAESYYILGKVAHAQGDTKSAFEFYREALVEAPDMALAAFGAAQILFSGKDFDQALDLFEKVLKTSSDDKDTLAYVLLLKGMQRGEQASMEKVRESAAGFQFDFDLWLSQAELRHKRSELKPDNRMDYPAALRCYSHAVECMKARGLAVPVEVLNNMGVLSFALGKKERALDCFVQAFLAETSTLNEAADEETAVWFSAPELVQLAHRETPEPACLVQRVDAAGEEAARFCITQEGKEPFDLTKTVKEGDRVRIGNCVWTVDAVLSPSELSCSAPPCIMEIAADDAALPLRLLSTIDLCSERSMGLAFNVARALEELGSTAAASELYSHITRRHPSCLDGRCSLVARFTPMVLTCVAWMHCSSAAIERYRQEPGTVGSLCSLATSRPAPQGGLY
jgi:tetratricopeptide (TPR) repeat protein